MQFITQNKHKIREVSRISGLDLTIIRLKLPEIQAVDLDEVLKAKGRAVKGDDDFIVEDTALYLGKRKDIGALIKWFSNDRIVKAYLGEEAEAVCGIYCKKNNTTTIFTGSIKGKIVRPRGKMGFGWDCIFRPYGHLKTFAEMTEEEKNKISHRRKAFDKLKIFLA